MSRRRFLKALLASASAGLSVTSQAQAWPQRPIRFVVPYAAGGGPDVLTRQTLPHLSKSLGQSIVVDNRVGAGGSISAEHVVQQKPDGYTWLLGASTHVTQKLLQPSLNFDPIKSFAHVSRLSYSSSVIVVASTSPYKTLGELLKAGADQSGKWNYGSGGIGSAAHLAGSAFSRAAGIDAVHVPYRGSVDLPTALMVGDIQFAIPTASTVLPLIQSGRLRALAITSAQRDPAYANLPTLKEVFGSDDLVQVAWSGVWLPAGTDPGIVRKIFEALRAVHAAPEIVADYARVGATVSLSESESEFTSFVGAETAKFARIVKNLRIATT